MEIHDFAAARICLQRCIENGRDILVFKIQKAFLDLREGEIASVDQLLNSHLDYSNLHLQEVSLLSRLYLARGLHLSALEVIYSARRKQHDVQVDRLYAGTFFNLPKDQMDWLNVDKIAGDSAFELTADDGSARWFIIETRERANNELREIAVDDPFVQQILGRKKGEKLELPNSHFKSKFKISAIVHKYVLAYQECLPSVAVRTINTTDPAELLKELIANTEERKDFVLRLEDAYRSISLPFERFAELSGVDPFDLWRCLASSKGMHLICSDGSDDEMRLALRILTTGAKLVLDLSSILSIAAFPKLQDSLIANGRVLLAPQSAIDAFENMIFSRHGHKSGGYSIFSSNDGKVALQEVSKETIFSDEQNLKSLVIWLRKNCRVVPCHHFLKLMRSERQYREELLGDVGAEAIALCQQEGAILYTDDFVLRKFAHYECKIATTWTEAILEDLHTRNLIEEDIVSELKVALAESNYTYVHVNPLILWKAVIKDGMSAGSAFQRTTALLDENTTYESCLGVVWLFLFHLFGTNTGINEKWLITEQLLDAASKSRDRKKFYNDMMVRVENLPLNNFGRKLSIGQALERWAISRLVVLPK